MDPHNIILIMGTSKSGNPPMKLALNDAFLHLEQGRPSVFLLYHRCKALGSLTLSPKP